MTSTNIQTLQGVQLSVYGAPSSTSTPQAVSNTSAPSGSAAPPSSTNNTTTLSSDEVNISNPVTAKNLDTVRAIEQLHNKMNSLIKGVRETNEAINNASEQANRMTSTLEVIAKSFPPFPTDSKDRQEILMSYTSLRQEILKMTFPPPPAPIYEKVKSTWDDLFAQNGQISATAVPAVGSDSSNQSVHDTLQKLRTTTGALTSLSSEITQALVQA